MRRINRIALLAAVAAVMPASAYALDWDGGGADNNWSTANNWNPNGTPPTDDPGTIYNFLGAVRTTPNVDQNWATTAVGFGANGFTLNASPGVLLTLYGTSNARVLFTSANFTSVVNVPVKFAVATSGSGFASTINRALDVSTNALMTVNGAIDSNGGSVVKSGAGTLVLTNANTFAPGTYFGFNANPGTTRLGNTTSLGNATIVHDNGVFSVAGGAATSGNGNLKLVNNNTASELTINNALVLGGTGNFGLTETSVPVNNNSVINYAGPVTISGTKPIGVETNSVGTISGQIVDGSSAGGINKGNPGTLILSNVNNTFTGGVTLNVGSIRAGSNTAFGTGTVTAASAGFATNLSAIGDRTFANALTLGGTQTLQFGQSGFTNGNMTFNGPVSLTGLNVDTIADNADDAKTLSVSTGMTTTLSNSISEDNPGSAIIKAGPGTLVLGGSNSFTGPMTVTGSGMLKVDGTNTANALVTAGTLAGTGRVRILSVYDGTADSIANGGTLSPGDNSAVGTLNAGRADFADGGNYLFNLNSVSGGAGVGYDLLNLDGTGTANGNLNITATSGSFGIKVVGPATGFNDAISQSFTLVQALGVTGFSTGAFTLDTTGFGPAFTGSFSLAKNGNNLDLVYTAIPEPVSIGLLGMGLMLLKRRRPTVA